MLNVLRTQWTKIAAGIALVGALGVGGITAYERYTGSCCAPGAPCCNGGSCCMNRHQMAQR